MRGLIWVERLIWTKVHKSIIRPGRELSRSYLVCYKIESLFKTLFQLIFETDPSTDNSIPVDSGVEYRTDIQRG